MTKGRKRAKAETSNVRKTVIKEKKERKWKKLTSMQEADSADKLLHSLPCSAAQLADHACSAAQPAANVKKDARKNEELQKAKKDFYAYAKNNDVPETDFVTVLRRFFGGKGHMESLWNELRRQRQGADLSIREAWTALCSESGSNKAKARILWSMLTLPRGQWQGKLLEEVKKNIQRRSITTSVKPVPYAQLQKEMGKCAASQMVTSGMFKTFTNSFGVPMVMKREQEMLNQDLLQKTTRHTRIIYTFIFRSYNCRISHTYYIILDLICIICCNYNSYKSKI